MDLISILGQIQKSTLLRSSGIYVISNLANVSVPFFLMPLLTKTLTPEDYGMVTMFQVVTSIAIPFIGLNFYGAISRQAVEREKIDLPVYVGTCIIIMGIAGIIMEALFFLFRGLFSQYLSIPETLILSVVFYLLFQSIIQITLVLLQMESKAILYAIFSFLQVVLNAGLSIYLVVNLHYGWQGRISAQIISSVAFGIIAIGFLVSSSRLRFHYNNEYAKNALCFGLPLIPHSLAGLIQSVIDRFFILNFVGIAQTGIYSVGNHIGMIISIVESSFIQAWCPFFFQKMKTINETEKHKIVVVTYGYFAFLCFITLSLSISIPWMQTWLMGKSFYGATSFVFWLASSYALIGMYKMVVGYIFFAEKTAVIPVITFFSTVFQLLATYFGIRYFGTIGAAYARTAQALFLFLATWYFSHKIFPMPWLHSLKGVISFVKKARS